jgi:hypothetical protein
VHDNAHRWTPSAAEATHRYGGGVAPHGGFLRKWGEGGEGMPAATSNRPEHGLPAVTAQAEQSRGRKEGRFMWRAKWNGERVIPKRFKFRLKLFGAV